MVFNATFNNISVISWRSVLLVEETVGPAENYRPVASHWQSLSHNVVSSTPHLIGFHMITATMAPGTTLCNCKKKKKNLTKVNLYLDHVSWYVTPNLSKITSLTASTLLIFGSSEETSLNVTCECLYHEYFFIW
jgi:hypothetical protein